jgi:hypothetical protein
MLKTAVAEPIPKAKVTAATAVNPGRFAKARAAKRISVNRGEAHWFILLKDRFLPGAARKLCAGYDTGSRLCADTYSLSYAAKAACKRSRVRP